MWFPTQEQIFISERNEAEGSYSPRCQVHGHLSNLSVPLNKHINAVWH